MLRQMKKTHDKDTYTHILKYTSLFGGVQGLNILVGIIRNKLVAVLLGPDGMGLVSLFNSTTTLLGNSTNFGLPMSAVKNIAEAYDRGDEAAITRMVSVVRLWSVLTAVLGTLLCVVLSPWLSRFTFSWDGHTLHFICLAPAVGLTALAGGELAILKGARQLRALAASSVYVAIAALVVSVPIFYFFRQQGIVPVLVLLALMQLLLTIIYSFRRFPLRLNWSRKRLGEGYSMVRLGLAFVVAGMLTAGAEFLIRSYLNNVAGIDTVGLYNAAFTLTITYVGMVFSAMETDYFPRLSGINQLGVTFNMTVNRQVEVMLLIVSPMLVGFMIALPLLVPMLYSGRFLPAVGMMQILVLAMYLRALKLPVQYIPLAKGDSKAFLFVEATYDILLVGAVIIFFDRYGLTGAGIAILLMAIVDLLLAYGLGRFRYGYRPSATVLLYASLQMPFGIAAYALTFTSNPLVYWSCGALLTLCSLTLSLFILRRKTHLWNKLTRKLRKDTLKPNPTVNHC